MSRRDLPDKGRSYRDKRRQQIADWVNAYLETHPCVWCGESNPIVLEFDHLDHGEKRWSIAHASRKVYSIASLEKEVAKTQVLCANCHRVKTARERGTARWTKYGHALTTGLTTR